jgi:hypothetical protein
VNVDENVQTERDEDGQVHHLSVMKGRSKMFLEDEHHEERRYARLFLTFSARYAQSLVRLVTVRDGIASRAEHVSSRGCGASS